VGKLFCGKLEKQAGILPERYYHISGGNVNKMACGSGIRKPPAIVFVMKNSSIENFSEQNAHTLLNILAPGSMLASITVPDGSFSNFTHILEARRKDGTLYKVVVRRYKIFGNYDRGEKARREFKTFELLNRYQVHAPEALLLDESGDILGSPGTVVSFVPGNLKMDTVSEPLAWARKLAYTLAKIHSIPCGEEEQRFLLKGNTEATWFLNGESPPAYMQEYPGGSEVWCSLRDQFPTIQPIPPVLLHLDYWSGNILWHEDEISAVIDWEEAAYGDPGVDVGYALMNITLMGLPDAAHKFLQAYEFEMGNPVRNLGFWKLAVTVRPMTDPQGWRIDRSPGKDIFLNFVEEAKKKLES
jgi:aminoglycoside phosphotransferase (APT) family kinase protein